MKSIDSPRRRSGHARFATLPESSESTAVNDAHQTPNDVAFQHNSAVDDAASPLMTIPPFVSHVRKPSTGLHLQTELPNPSLSSDAAQNPPHRSSIESYRGQLLPSPTCHRRSSLTSHRSLDDFSALSPSSSISSPALGALTDVTPLPSPLVRSNSPELWRRLLGRRRGSSGASIRDRTSEDSQNGLLPPTSWPASPPKRSKAYPKLGSPTIATVKENDVSHVRDRSLSEYRPDSLSNVRQNRNITAPGAGLPQQVQAEQMQTPPSDQVLHREEYLSGPKRRDLHSNDPTRGLPSPPASNQSTTGSEDGEDTSKPSKESLAVIRVHLKSGAIQGWRPIRQLGHGAFSEVVLATRDTGAPVTGPLTEQQFDSSQLAAIKIVKHDPSGGSDEDRMETSIGREIEILKTISHPCLPGLLAFDDSKARALLVLNYCPGGDLFELASQQRSLLTPGLIQRIFAELVGAVSYLHENYIVHRDIKLENVLFTLPLAHLPSLTSPQHHPYPLTTLTDLGLSKRIPRPPESPLLTHHCGSADYAAPELLLQRPYDGRSTDMWALGVLLYALMEGRLPFDPLPGKRRQGSVKHRIAVCEWLWVEWGDEHGDWNGGKEKDKERGRAFEGAKDCVEGLLKKAGRGRWSEEMVREHRWVREGICVLWCTVWYEVCTSMEFGNFGLRGSAD